MEKEHHLPCNNDRIISIESTLPTERINLNQTDPCLVPDSKVKRCLKINIKGNADGMCHTSRGVLKPVWKELQSFFKGFHSKFVISGISGNKVVLSPDRNLTILNQEMILPCFKFCKDNIMKNQNEFDAGIDFE